MSFLGVFLLLTVCISFGATVFQLAPYEFVYVDKSGSTKLECEWRGSGKHCKSFVAAKKKDGMGQYIYLDQAVGKDVTDEEILARLTEISPRNTFKISKNLAGKKCESRGLWCNAFTGLFTDDQDQITEFLIQHGPKRVDFLNKSQSLGTF